VSLGQTIGTPDSTYIERFTQSINDDLNTAQAIALTWELLKDHSVSDADKLATIFKFDEVLGLSLKFIWECAGDKEEEWSPDIQSLLEKRAQARTEKNWGEADRLRDELATLRVEVKDTPDGQKAKRIGSRE